MNTFYDNIKRSKKAAAEINKMFAEKGEILSPKELNDNVGIILNKSKTDSELTDDKMG